MLVQVQTGPQKTSFLTDTLCCTAMHFGRVGLNNSHFHAKLCIAWGFQTTSCSLLSSSIYASSPNRAETLPGRFSRNAFVCMGKNPFVWANAGIRAKQMIGGCLKATSAWMGSRMQRWVWQPAVDIYLAYPSVVEAKQRLKIWIWIRMKAACDGSSVSTENTCK